MNVICGCTIFLAQLLSIRPWPKAQPTMNVRREWVKELGFSEPLWSDAWKIKMQKVEDKRHEEDLPEMIVFLFFVLV